MINPRYLLTYKNFRKKALEYFNKKDKTFSRPSDYNYKNFNFAFVYFIEKSHLEEQIFANYYYQVAEYIYKYNQMKDKKDIEMFDYISTVTYESMISCMDIEEIEKDLDLLLVRKENRNE